MEGLAIKLKNKYNCNYGQVSTSAQTETEAQKGNGGVKGGTILDRAFGQNFSLYTPMFTG